MENIIIFIDISSILFVFLILFYILILKKNIDNDFFIFLILNIYFFKKIKFFICFYLFKLIKHIFISWRTDIYDFSGIFIFTDKIHL